MKKLLFGISLLAIALLVGAAVFSPSKIVKGVSANGQETCPQTGDWVKVDNINALSYKYTAPAGKEIFESCYKAGTTLRFAQYNPAVTEVELQSNVWNKSTCPGDKGCNFQKISHASFRLRPTTSTEVCEDKEALNYGEEEDCEYPEITPTPTPTPTATPTPGTPDKERSSLYVQQLACFEYDFRAQMDLKSGSNPQKDVLVSFTYNGLSKNAYTNQDGRASVSFTFVGEGLVKATPNNGYKSQEAMVTAETDCSAVGGPIGGQVLGANTYAETGILEDIMMSVIGLSGATMTAVGAQLHAKKKN